MMTKRIAWIDIVRAIGMLLIVMGHTLFIYQFSYLARAIFAVHVPIFFVLSGYLFHLRSVVKQVKHLFINLVLPYLFTAIIIVVGSIIINQTKLHDLPFFMSLGSNKASILAGVYGIGTATRLSLFNNHLVLAIGAIWFLLAMFIGHLVFNVLQLILSNKKYKLALLWLISILLVYFSTKTQFGLLPWSFNAGLMSVIFYTFGFTLQQYKLLTHIPIWLLLIGTLFWGLSVRSGFFYMNVVYADNLVWAILGAFGASVVLCWVAQKLAKLALIKPLSIIGRYSLIVLCAHVIDLDLIRIASGLNSHVTSFAGPVMGTAVAISYRIVFACLFIYLVPKIPLVRCFYLNKQFPFQNFFKGKLFVAKKLIYIY